METSADFDGDGRIDAARLLVDTPGVRHALWITIAPSGRVRHLKVIEGSVAELARVGVDEAPPGVHATACGKGMGSGPCPAATLKLDHSGISYFTFESGTEYIGWSNGRLVRDFVSD